MAAARKQRAVRGAVAASRQAAGHPRAFLAIARAIFRAGAVLARLGPIPPAFGTFEEGRERPRAQEATP